MGVGSLEAPPGPCWLLAGGPRVGRPGRGAASQGPRGSSQDTSPWAGACGGGFVLGLLCDQHCLSAGPVLLLPPPRAVTPPESHIHPFADVSSLVTLSGPRRQRLCVCSAFTPMAAGQTWGSVHGHGAHGLCHPPSALRSCWAHGAHGALSPGAACEARGLALLLRSRWVCWGPAQLPVWGNALSNSSVPTGQQSAALSGVACLPLPRFPQSPARNAVLGLCLCRPILFAWIRKSVYFINTWLCFAERTLKINLFI